MTAIARRVTGNIQEIGQYAVLVWETLHSLLREKKYWREIIYQIYFIGVKSQSVVFITGDGGPSPGDTAAHIDTPSLAKPFNDVDLLAAITRAVSTCPGVP